MTPSGDPWKPDLGDRVSRLEKVKGTALPAPILARAEQLCDLVDEADGIRPDRQTLIAALVYAAVADGHRLATTWQDYRTAPVHEVVIGDLSTHGEVDLTPYKQR